MIARCFLHIGTEKTGTTTIQSFLAQNRDRLREQGVMYPSAPGNHNHIALAAYALRRTGITARHRLRQPETFREVRQFRDELIDNLDAELRNANASNLIFSNEHLSSRVLDDKNIRPVKELCDRYAEDT